MRHDVEFRLKSVVARAPKGPSGTVGHWPMNQTKLQLSDKASKLGSAIPPYIKSEVPPADHSSEVAIAAPSKVHAPMEAWLMAVANHRQDGCFGCELTQAKAANQRQPIGLAKCSTQSPLFASRKAAASTA